MKSSVRKKATAGKKAEKGKVSAASFCVYILEMENGSFYTGYTDDLAARWRKHASGKGAKFTRAFRPVRIAACWNVSGEKGDAMRVEAFIKSLARSAKDGLVAKPAALRRLYLERKGAVLLLRPLSARALVKAAQSALSRSPKP